MKIARDKAKFASEFVFSYMFLDFFQIIRESRIRIKLTRKDKE